MTELVRRRATIFVGSLKLEGFRMAFTVKKSVESNANTAEASIYALNEASRSTLESTEKPAFIIDAGYEQIRGVIFSGEAVRPSSTKQPTGWVTRVEAADGHTAQRALVNKTMGKGSTVSQVIKELAGAMGVASKDALSRAASGDFDGAIKAFDNGLTLTGTAKGNMDSLASSVGFEWSIQDGELVILKAQETKTTEAIVLSPATGLLGSPELATDEKRPKKRIVKLRSLLNARLNPGGRIQVLSEQVKGIFKINNLVHKGDTFGGDWVTELEAVELTGVVAA